MAGPSKADSRYLSDAARRSAPAPVSLQYAATRNPAMSGRRAWHRVAPSFLVVRRVGEHSPCRRPFAFALIFAGLTRPGSAAIVRRPVSRKEASHAPAGAGPAARRPRAFRRGDRRRRGPGPVAVAARLARAPLLDRPERHLRRRRGRAGFVAHLRSSAAGGRPAGRGRRG